MSPKQKARLEGLIELALDNAAGSEKERNAAAMKVCRLIRKYDLLSNPLEDMINASPNETVQAVKGIADALMSPALRKNVKKVAEGFRRRR